MDSDWDNLQKIAEDEIEATLSELPQPLRERAQALPFTLEPRPSEALVADGIAPDTLGLFVRPEYAHEETSPLPLPPQIILFLENLWEISDGDEGTFRDEIHTTYVHELGHYLGLDEDDLYDCGLD